MSTLAAPIVPVEPIPIPASTVDSVPIVPGGAIIRYEDQLVTRRMLAHWLNISVSRLSVWAREGLGPPPIRIGNYKTAYRVGDVLAYLRAQSADVCPDVRKGKNQKSF